MGHITNDIMHKHFAWFDQEVATAKSAELLEDVVTQEEYTHEQQVVFNYFVTHLLHRKRKLGTVSYDEVMYNKGIINWDELEQRTNDGVLFFPFKSE